jgi:hypothetical protein
MEDSFSIPKVESLSIAEEGLILGHPCDYT